MSHPARLRSASTIGALLLVASCGTRSALDADPAPDLDSGTIGTPGPLRSDDAGAPDGASPVGTDDAALPRGPRVVLFGGDGINGQTASGAPILSDTWMFDGASWSPVVTSVSPPARTMASMASVGVGDRARVLLFGGLGTDGLPMNDTWLFDGASWSQVQSPTAPPARFGASVAPLGDRVVLFGGQAQFVLALADTWVFDGTEWSAVPGAGPPARWLATMGAVGDEVLLFGGAGPSGAALGDTWTFDGATWSSEGALVAPPARYGATSATLDTTFYVFGGMSGFTDDATSLGDTWAFDGTEWTATSVTGAPPPAYPAAAAPLQGSLVGIEVFDNATTTWTFDGTSWSETGGDAPFMPRVMASMGLLR